MVSSIFATCVTLAAQSNASSPLDALAGKWVVEGEMRAMGPRPASKMISHENCEWLEGKVAVVCHINSEIGSGRSTGLSVHTFDAQQGTFQYYSVNSAGTTELSKGSAAGEEMWVWNGNLDYHGHPTKTRLTIKRVSPEKEAVKLESVDGEGHPTLIMEGTRRKE